MRPPIRSPRSVPTSSAIRRTAAAGRSLAISAPEPDKTKRLTCQRVQEAPLLAFSRGLRLASLRIFAGIPAAVPDGFWSRLSLQSIAITQSRVLVKDTYPLCDRCDWCDLCFADHFYLRGDVDHLGVGMPF